LEKEEKNKRKKLGGFNLPAGITEDQIQQGLAFLDQHIDQKIEAKLKEVIPKVSEGIVEYIRSTQTQTLLNPQSVQVSSVQQNPLLQQALVAGINRFLGGGGGSLKDRLREYAELKQSAEIIAGKALEPKDMAWMIFNAMNLAFKMSKGYTPKREDFEKTFMGEEKE